MKKALKSTNSQSATDARIGFSDFAACVSATQVRSARRVVSQCAGNLGPRRLARIAIELGWLFGRDFIPNRRSACAVEKLIRALNFFATLEPDGSDAQVFEDKANEWLNALIDGVTSGFGEFDARFSIDGSVTFVGEPDEVSQVLLHIDHRKNVRRRRLHADLPRYCIEVRSTGEKFDCRSLQGALHVMQKTKAFAIEMVCDEAQVLCDARRGGAT